MLQLKQKVPFQLRASQFLEKFLSGDTRSYRQVIAIIVPVLVDQAFMACFNILNTAMISSSGVAAVSAVSMVDSLNFFLVNVFIAVATGGTVVVAQYKGSGNEEMVSKSAAQALSAVALLSVAIGGIIIILHNPMLNLLFGKADADVMENARIYLIGSCISYPCFAIFQSVVGALRGVADTKASLVLSLINNLTYVFCNILFITMMKMGVTGLVVSLNLARFIGMLASVFYILRMNHHINFRLKELIKFDFSIQKKILYIGIPFAAEQMFFHGGKLITQTFIVQLGTMALTVNAITSSMVSLIQIVGSALCTAVVTVVGQCIGHKDVAGAKKYIKAFVVLASVGSILSTVIVLPLFPVLVQFYSPPAEIVRDIFILMVLCGIAQPVLWSASFIVPAGLRAAGDSKYTSIAAMISMWAFRVIMGYIFGIVLGFGIIGVWCAMILEWGVREIIFCLRLKGQKWFSHQLI